MAKESITQKNWSTYKTSVPVHTPFSAYLEKRTTDNKATGDDDPVAGGGVGLAFVQAFVVDYLTLQQASNAADDPDLKNERMAIVENMDKVFQIELDGLSRIFEVQIDLNPDGSILKANFQKKPRETEDNFRPPEDKIDNFNIDTDPTCGKVFLPVCEVIDGVVVKVWLRDNIHWWGELLGGAGEKKSWTPIVTPRDGGGYDLNFNFGTVNGRLPDNFNSNISMSQAQYDTLQYIYLSVAISENVVNSLTYNFTSNASSITETDPVSEGVLPPLINVFIGTLHKGSSCMSYTKPLYATPYIWLNQPKETAKFGEYPYTVWFKYKIEEV